MIVSSQESVGSNPTNPPEKKFSFPTRNSTSANLPICTPKSSSPQRPSLDYV